MSLARLAVSVGASPRWILNTRAQLGLPVDTGVGTALLLALIRTLHADAGLSLAEAHRCAADLMDRERRGEPWVVKSAAGVVAVAVDRARFLTDHALRLARARSGVPARGRPRRPPPGGLGAARKYGIDLSLLRDSLRRTPAERLRRLDQDAAFLQSLRVAGS